MAGFYVTTGGAPRKSKAVWVFTGGAWRKAKAVWVYTGGAWRKQSFGYTGTLISASWSGTSYSTFIGKPSVPGVGSFVGEGEIDGQVPSVEAVGMIHNTAAQAYSIVCTVLNITGPFFVEFSYGGITKTYQFASGLQPIPGTAADFNWLQSLLGLPVTINIYK